MTREEITPDDLKLQKTGEWERVICLTPHELLTSEKIVPFQSHPGTAPGVDVEHQIERFGVFLFGKEKNRLETDGL